jgi:hypothetical protein
MERYYLVIIKYGIFGKKRQEGRICGPYAKESLFFVPFLPKLLVIIEVFVFPVFVLVKSEHLAHLPLWKYRSK